MKALFLNLFTVENSKPLSPQAVLVTICPTAHGSQPNQATWPKAMGLRLKQMPVGSMCKFVIFRERLVVF